MNQVKEDLCFVSEDLKEDMEIARLKFPANTIVRDYVLPDYSTIKRGFIRPLEKTGSKATNNEQVNELKVLFRYLTLKIMIYEFVHVMLIYFF